MTKIPADFYIVEKISKTGIPYKTLTCIPHDPQLAGFQPVIFLSKDSNAHLDTLNMIATMKSK